MKNNGNYKYIVRAVDEYVKCHVTLKSIREQISPLIKSITDNDEEYDALMEVIPRFYRDTWNDDKENVLFRGHTGNTYENRGDEGSVSPPQGAIDESQQSGMLLSIHNHPLNSTAFQSKSDYMSQVFGTKEKYGITISKQDGIVISKNNATPSLLAMYAYDINYNKMDREFKKEYKDEINELESNLQSRKMTIKQVNKVYNDYYHKHISDNIDKYADSLTDQFNKRDADIKVYHTNIKRGR